MPQLIFVVTCSRDTSCEIKYTMGSLVGAVDCNFTVLTIERMRMRVSKSRRFKYLTLSAMSKIGSKGGKF